MVTAFYVRNTFDLSAVERSAATSARPSPVAWMRVDCWERGFIVEGLRCGIQLRPSLDYHNLIFLQAPIRNPRIEFVGTPGRA